MRFVFFSGWWLLLLGLWLLLVGTSDRVEVIAGACAAALGAALAEAVRAQGLLYRLRGVPLVPVVRIPVEVGRDFGIITWALLLHLARAQPVRSAYATVPAPGADSPGRRALATVIATVSPNSVVVDVDRKQRVALVHALVPGRASKTVP